MAKTFDITIRAREEISHVSKRTVTEEELEELKRTVSKGSAFMDPSDLGLGNDTIEEGFIEACDVEIEIHNEDGSSSHVEFSEDF